MLKFEESTKTLQKAARSAPLMRGLKLGSQSGSWARIRSCRAVCPANEGIETGSTRDLVSFPVFRAARSAPLMRGLKH